MLKATLGVALLGLLTGACLAVPTDDDDDSCADIAGTWHATSLDDKGTEINQTDTEFTQETCEVTGTTEVTSGQQGGVTYSVAGAVEGDELEMKTYVDGHEDEGWTISNGAIDGDTITGTWHNHGQWGELGGTFEMLRQ